MERRQALAIAGAMAVVLGTGAVAAGAVSGLASSADTKVGTYTPIDQQTPAPTDLTASTTTAGSGGTASTDLPEATTTSGPRARHEGSEPGDDEGDGEHTTATTSRESGDGEHSSATTTTHERDDDSGTTTSTTEPEVDDD